MRWELAWDTTDARTIGLSVRPTYIGRGPANDVVVGDGTVSTRHAAVWVDAEGVWVEDLKSRNGTWVNGRSLTGTGKLKSGDSLRLGEATQLVVRAVRRAQAAVASGYMVVDSERDLAVVMRSERMRIGGSADAAIRVADVDDVVLSVDDGSLWLNRDGDLEPIALNTPFQVGEHRFEVRETPVATAPTQEAQDPTMPYILEAQLGGDAPMARIIDRVGGTRVDVTAGTQVALLWQLAQAVVRDQANGVLRSQVGWCDARDLRVGVWGREAAEAEERLNLLVFRVRKQLKEAGLDGAVIERRLGQIRANVREASTGS